jgi:hypothetical protein
MSRGTPLYVLTAALFSTSPGYPHHSFIATYEQDREITIEGEIAAFLFRNPHAFVHVLAPDESGDMRRWAVEWGAATALRDVTRDTLKAGEHVVVIGNPGRNPSDHQIRLQSITRPADGWHWSGSFD